MFPVATSQFKFVLHAFTVWFLLYQFQIVLLSLPCQISKLNLGSSQFYWSLILIGACFFQYTSLDILDSKIPDGDVLFGGRAVDAEINKTKLFLPVIIWLARLAGKMALSCTLDAILPARN